MLYCSGLNERTERGVCALAIRRLRIVASYDSPVSLLFFPARPSTLVRATTSHRDLCWNFLPTPRWGRHLSPAQDRAISRTLDPRLELLVLLFLTHQPQLPSQTKNGSSSCYYRQARTVVGERFTSLPCELSLFFPERRGLNETRAHLGSFLPSLPSSPPSL